MKKINWNIFNIALWIEMILSYALPFKTADHFQYQAGFPIPFLTIYNTEIGISPLMSMSLQPFGLLLNGLIIYVMITVCIKLHHKMKQNQTKGT